MTSCRAWTAAVVVAILFCTSGCAAKHKLTPEAEQLAVATATIGAVEGCLEIRRHLDAAGTSLLRNSVVLVRDALHETPVDQLATRVRRIDPHVAPFAQPVAGLIILGVQQVPAEIRESTALAIADGLISGCVASSSESVNIGAA